MKTKIEKFANIIVQILKWILQKIIIPLYKLVKKFFKKNPELLTFPITFGIWFGMGLLIKWFRPEEEPFPLIFIQDILFTTMKVAVYISAAWYTFKLTFGTYTRYQLSKEEFKDKGLKEGFKLLTEWQKILITTLVFLAVLFDFVLVG